MTGYLLLAALFVAMLGVGYLLRHRLLELGLSLTAIAAVMAAGSYLAKQHGPPWLQSYVTDMQGNVEQAGELAIQAVEQVVGPLDSFGVDDAATVSEKAVASAAGTVVEGGKALGELDKAVADAKAAGAISDGTGGAKGKTLTLSEAFGMTGGPGAQDPGVTRDQLHVLLAGMSETRGEKQRRSASSLAGQDVRVQDVLALAENLEHMESRTPGVRLSLTRSVDAAADHVDRIELEDGRVVSMDVLRLVTAADRATLASFDGQLTVSRALALLGGDENARRQLVEASGSNTASGTDPAVAQAAQGSTDSDRAVADKGPAQRGRLLLFDADGNPVGAASVARTEGTGISGRNGVAEAEGTGISGRNGAAEAEGTGIGVRNGVAEPELAPENRPVTTVPKKRRSSGPKDALAPITF